MTIGGIVAAIKRKGLDVVVIDDGSRDASGPTAKTQGAVVIRQDPKQGKGRSLQTGFRYALAHGYSGVLTMDGDGQHDVEDIDAFLKQAGISPGGIIAGTRMHNPQGMPVIRLVTNRFMSFLISMVCRQPIPDTQCGFRYISREVLQSVQLTSQEFEIETEVLVQASRKGYKISSVPVKTIYRNEVSKIHPVKDTIRFFVYLAKAVFRSSP
jgi:glycosyltransferase involved in cell wall biosynthesis